MKTTLKMNMKKLETFASWLLENQAQRNLEIKLEVSEVEKDLLHEEIHELKIALENSLNKSNTSKKSSKKVSNTKNSSNGNYFSCNQSYKSTNSRTNSNNSISEEYTPKFCNYCGKIGHMSYNCRF
ncbi:hypothetical protein H5410_061995 [Solanum commersonii]|uniref:CCHC-type domain-containing protein n=1 Tax=Solanum commersonii TaxID=4109 RepID=A0A9J5W9H3_SOLCO|nr:hypothetical protein H5410_061995 [Solanum commersonii]